MTAVRWWCTLSPPHFSVHLLPSVPGIPPSWNLHFTVAGVALGSWGGPLPLTPALPQHTKALRYDASEQEVLVNHQLTWTGAGQGRAHHKRPRGEYLLLRQSQRFRVAAI